MAGESSNSVRSAPRGAGRRHARRLGGPVAAVRTHPLLALLVLAVLTWIVTRTLLVGRFPWFIDETVYATEARLAQAFPDQRFAGETFHEGLLASWLGAGLIGRGVAPLLAMRLLSSFGVAVAAASTGWLLLKTASREIAVGTVALVLLCPFFTVEGSVGIFDPLATGLVALVVALSVRLAQRRELSASMLMGVALGCGLLIKSTAAVALVLIPLSAAWLPSRERRVLGSWLLLVALAVVIALVITQLEKLSPLYYMPGPHNHVSPLHVLHGLGARLANNIPDAAGAVTGYVTWPGLALALVGLNSTRGEHRRLGMLLFAWLLLPVLSGLTLPYYAFPRYFAASIPPFCALCCLGARAIFLAVRCHLPRYGYLPAACVICAAALPAAVLDLEVLIDPRDAPYPGRDSSQYVTGWAAVEPAHAAARVISARAASGKVEVALAGTQPYPFDLLLNPGRAHPINRFSFSYVPSGGAPPAGAEFVIADQHQGPWPGYRSVLTVARPRHGLTLRVFERAG